MHAEHQQPAQKINLSRVPQTLAAPEHCSGGGVEPLRRLTWRCIYHHTCYYLTLTVLQRFARSQISINGFVLESRKHSLLTQVRATSA